MEALETQKLLAERRQNFLDDNRLNWDAIGANFRKQRESHCISLQLVAETLGTSSSRIRRFEKGEPIQMANQLEKSYELFFEHLMLRSQMKIIHGQSRIGRTF